MSRFRAYIKPFDYNGNYRDDWIDVSDDVDFDKIGKLSRQIDANYFDVGVFKFSQLNITFLNALGKYAGVEVFQSIFKTKISNSLFKITWDANDYYCRAGMAPCGYVSLYQETELFRGLINDVPGQMDVDSQAVTFQVLGLESVFQQVANPGNLSNGDIFSALIYKILNQSDITDLMTVDPGNITLGLDGYIVDDVTQYDTKTVKEILDNLLFISNSVLYVKDATVYVVPRFQGGSSLKTFFGQASPRGVENIVSIQNLNTGAAKMFNYWTWDQTLIHRQDDTSVLENGISKNNVSGIDEILTTNTSLIGIILAELALQYRFLKQEFDITIPCKFDTVQLFLMDHVTVDYPTVFIAADNSELPLYGSAIYGESRYPIGQWQLTIPYTDDYQIIGWAIDTKNQNMILSVKKFN